MERVSNREYEIRKRWKFDQLNNPSRTDYYIMKAISYLQLIPTRGKPKSLDDVKLNFSRTAHSASEQTDDERRASHREGGGAGAWGGGRR